MKCLQHVLAALVLNIVWGSCWATPAHAAVITPGSWAAMSPDAYWNNPSWDGPGLNVGELITSWGWPVQQLSAAGAPTSFAFDQPQLFWEITSITAWMEGRGIWQLPDGSISFATHGYTYNTLTDPNQFSLFRHVAATHIVYFLGVEDIPLLAGGDRDFNDYIGYSIEQLPPPPPPVPTPEPGTLLLMLSGGLIALRKKRP
jgi:hypothetical protein